MKSVTPAVLFMLCFFGLSFADESLTITTYYPSPYGSYAELTVSNTLTVGTVAQPAVTSIRGSTTIIGDTLYFEAPTSLVIKGPLAIEGNTIIHGNINVSGTGTALQWNVVSDQRFKNNIEILTGVLDKIKNLNGVTFNWNTDKFPKKGFTPKKQIGLIAQEVEREFPELIITGHDGYKSLDYDKFNAVLLTAVKEQQQEIDLLKKEITALKQR